jgi:hypothetical protein
VPGVGGSYWREFFPAVMILGLGMAVTVAPLTTVVMNSVGEDRAGTASGINNAVARVASVLAIAVLGIVMAKAFGARLDALLAHVSVPPEILQELRGNETKLAGLPVPAGVDDATRVAIQESVREAFVVGFRMVTGICVGLALASVVVAGMMIPKERSGGI